MATDKRLDQVSQLTDFDYALIVKGTDVAKVTKQQLAELVGNLLYGATNKNELASMVAGVIGTATPQKEGLFPKNRVCVYGTIGQGVTWAKITIPFTADGDGMALALNWFSTASNTSTAIANIIRWNAVAVKATLSFGEIVFELKYEVLDNTIILYVKTETSYGILSATPISIVGNAAISVEPYSGTIPATAKDVNVVTIN